MRVFVLTLALLLMAAVAVNAVDLTTEFYVAIGDFYDVPYEDVYDLSETGMADEDIAVVYFVADRAKIEASEVAADRKVGGSWSSIANSYGLDATTFYMMVAAKITSKTYKPLFEKYSSVPQSNWENVQLTDADIVNLVNLKFVGSHHDYTVFDIMAMRDYGKSFVKINHQARLAKEKILWKQQMAEMEEDEE